MEIDQGTAVLIRVLKALSIENENLAARLERVMEESEAKGKQLLELQEKGKKG